MSKGLSGKAAIMLMVSVLLFLGIAGWALLHWVLPQYWFNAYPLIPLVFVIFAVILVLLSLRWEKGVESGRTTQQRVAINLMGAKMGKLLLSLILILLYWKFWGEQTKTFFVVFAIFYAVSLFMETMVSVKFTQKYTRKG